LCHLPEEMKTLKPQSHLKRHLRPARYFRLAFLLLIPVVGCDSGLPIQPVEESLVDVSVALYQDSIEVVNDLVSFEPTFLGRSSVMEINIAYMDTFKLKLELELKDSSVFTVTPSDFKFSKASKQKHNIFTITFVPTEPDTSFSTYLLLKTFSDLLSPDSTMEQVAMDSLMLVGRGESYYLDLEMVFISGGAFFMGAGVAEDTLTVITKNPDEYYSHRVELSDFFIGRYEVTNQQYYEFWVEQGDSANRPDYSTVIGSWPQDAHDKPNHPVVGISWEDAMAFCRWLSLRTSARYTLPTEAQWEYVATGGEKRLYPWSSVEAELSADTLDDGRQEPVYLLNISGVSDGYFYTAPVDRFPAGASQFGPLNMSGNVWEWCLDWYDADYYKYTTRTRDPQGPADTLGLNYKVIRGGSWLEEIEEARCTNRGALALRNREYNVGFRVVRLP